MSDWHPVPGHDGAWYRAEWLAPGRWDAVEVRVRNDTGVRGADLRAVSMNRISAELMHWPSPGGDVTGR